MKPLSRGFSRHRSCENSCARRCVRLQRARPAVRVEDLNAFFRFVETIFQGRRKQLGGTLGRISGLGSTAAGSRLRDLGIDPERRPQTLKLEEWEGLYQEFRSPEG